VRGGEIGVEAASMPTRYIHVNIFVEHNEGKRLLRRGGSRWEDIIKLELKN
jgi:hypothetical protein